MVDPGARRNFGTLVAAALVDGELADVERQVLHRRATEMNIPLGLMNEIIDQARKGKLSMSVPSSDQAKEELFDQLIEIACADGRVEAPEYHLLAKFGAHLGLALPDLRARVKKHMERKAPRPSRIEPRIEPVRVRQEPLDSTSTSQGKSPKDLPAVLPQASPMPAPPSQSTGFLPPGPIRLEEARPADPAIADIPPVTLHLLKQSIQFETDADAVRYIERTLGLTRPEAEKIRSALLAAFPDLKPGSHQLKTGRR